MNLHNIKRLLERKCLSLPKNIKSQNKSVAMEIKLDRKKNHIAASDPCKEESENFNDREGQSNRNERMSET